MQDSREDLRDPEGASTNHVGMPASPLEISSDPSLLTTTKVQDLSTFQLAGLHLTDAPDGTSLPYSSSKPESSVALPESPSLTSVSCPSEPVPDSAPTLQKAFIAEIPSSTFDFQSFLDQMKTKSAEPVARYLRSFLTNFTKKPFPVNEQVKLIHDFHDFITAKMRECEVWRSMSSEEFDNACEAMEKLVMNRLYDYIFSPRIVRTGRQVTNDDLERDHVLRQRIQLLRWLRPEHLEIPTNDGSQGFVSFAGQELVKINHYKAPRDKTICILNTCKIIFGLIRHIRGAEGADSFLPLLIYIIIKANPDNFLSNIEYINRFRRPERLQGEIGYYLSSLSGAVSFIETMDHISLSNITKEDFERNIEQAVSELSSAPESASSPIIPLLSRDDPFTGDESAQPLRIPSVLPNTATIAEDTRRFFQRTGETITKPMNILGKFLSDAFDGPEASSPPKEQFRGENVTSSPQSHIPTPYQPRIRPSNSTQRRGMPQITREGSPSRMMASLGVSPPSWASTPLDFTVMQREIDRAHAEAAEAGRGTLFSIFPNVDPEVVGWVLEATNKDLGLSIEKLLEMGGT